MKTMEKVMVVTLIGALAGLIAGMRDYIKAMDRLPIIGDRGVPVAATCEPACLCQCHQQGCGCHDGVRTPNKTKPRTP